MKLLFVHDIKALRVGDQVFARSYGREIWERYLKVFSSVTVCTRCKQVESRMARGVDMLTGDNVRFDGRIGMFKGPEVFFNARIRDIIRADILANDGVIVRLDSFLGLLTIWECKKLKRPYLIEVVGCAWDSFWNHGPLGKVLAPFMFLLMRRAIKQAPYVIYVTKHFLQSRYPTKGLNTNISNVALPQIDDNILEHRLKRIEEMNDITPVHLMTAANVGVRYKGFQFVIKALGVIKKRMGRCRFVYHIVGEGDQTYLRKIARACNIDDNVVFHGGVKKAEVFRLLQYETDIYIQPSLQEGLPRAMIEAMSYGLPCIGTDVAGIPELLSSESIYRRRDNMPKSIASLLERFSKDIMLEQASANFNSAKNYSADILNARRTNFLETYVQTLTIQKQQ